MFIHSNQPLITSFCIKKGTFLAELAMSQRRSAIYCETVVWGLILIFLLFLCNRNEFQAFFWHFMVLFLGINLDLRCVTYPDSHNHQIVTLTQMVTCFLASRKCDYHELGPGLGKRPGSLGPGFRILGRFPGWEFENLSFWWKNL